MSKSEKIDFYAKVIDAFYKKLIILVAIAGGFGTYTIKFLELSNSVGYMFFVVFVLVSISIFITYMKMNINIKEMERIRDE